MLFSTCRKKRLVGQVTFSGQVKDSYSQKAMANIQIGVGEFSSNWLGQFYYLKEITVAVGSAVVWIWYNVLKKADRRKLFNCLPCVQTVVEGGFVSDFNTKK